MTKYKPRVCVLLPADAREPAKVIREQACDLPALQALVGGNIELVPISRKRLRVLEELLDVKLPGAQMYANETGMLDRLPVNQRATDLTIGMGHDWPIHGDCFVMKVP